MTYQVLLLSGKQGSGKSTIAKKVAEELQMLGHKVSFYKFADPLYSIASATIAKARDWGLQVPEGKPGRLLQLLGTDWGRAVLGENVWVECAKAQIKQRVEFYGEEAGKIYFIIDDCRFLNELQAFPLALKVRLQASEEVRSKRTDGWRPDTGHPSETGLDNYLKRFDLVLKNETDEELVNNVELITARLTSL